jgi:hypothetical protein
MRVEVKSGYSRVHAVCKGFEDANGRGGLVEQRRGETMKDEVVSAIKR